MRLDLNTRVQRRVAIAENEKFARVLAIDLDASPLLPEMNMLVTGVLAEDTAADEMAVAAVAVAHTDWRTEKIDSCEKSLAMADHALFAIAAQLVERTVGHNIFYQENDR